MKHYTKNILLVLFVLLFSACSISRRQTESQTIKNQEETVEVSENDRLKSTSLLIDASKQKILGNYARAYELYNEALEKDPGNDAAYFEISKLYVMDGNSRLGLQNAQKAAQLDPANPFYQILLADIHILQNQVDRAMKIYEQLAGAEPDNVDYQVKLLSVYIYNEEYGKALQLINHIELIIGFSQEYSIKKQQLLIELGRLDDAIEEAEKMIRYFPEETVFYELLGDLYLETGRPEKTEEVYLRLIDQDPDNYRGLLFLAEFYIENNKISKALDYLATAFYYPEMAIDLKARIIYTYIYYADDENNYLTNAAELAKELVSHYPSESEAFFVYGDVLLRKDQTELARDMYFKGLELDPSDVLVWQQLLNLSLVLGDYDTMLEHSGLALEYFFEQPVLFLFDGLANMQLKNYEAAASSLEYGLYITIEDEELKQDFITMLGDVYHFLGDYNESDRYYEEALALNPENAIALNNFSYHLSVRKERLDEALKMSEKANNLNPNNSAFQDTYGWIKYQMGNYEVAEIWIRKAIENAEDPGGVILEHYGDVMYQLGNLDTALEYWRKANETGEGSDLLDKKIRDRTLYE